MLGAFYCLPLKLFIPDKLNWHYHNCESDCRLIASGQLRHFFLFSEGLPPEEVGDAPRPTIHHGAGYRLQDRRPSSNWPLENQTHTHTVPTVQLETAVCSSLSRGGEKNASPPVFPFVFSAESEMEPRRVCRERRTLTPLLFLHRNPPTHPPPSDWLPIALTPADLHLSKQRLRLQPCSLRGRKAKREESKQGCAKLGWDSCFFCLPPLRTAKIVLPDNYLRETKTNRKKVACEKANSHAGSGQDI